MPDHLQQVRRFVQLEQSMVALERIKEYDCRNPFLWTLNRW